MKWSKCDFTTRPIVCSWRRQNRGWNWQLRTTGSVRFPWLAACLPAQLWGRRCKCRMYSSGIRVRLCECNHYDDGRGKI